MSEIPTAVAIAGMVGLAACDLVITHANTLAIAVVSALAGWLSHKAAAPPRAP